MTDEELKAIEVADSEGDAGGTWPGTGDFIAHARADVPALLAEVRRLSAERRELRRMLLRATADDLRLPLPDGTSTPSKWEVESLLERTK